MSINAAVSMGSAFRNQIIGQSDEVIARCVVILLSKPQPTSFAVTSSPPGQTRTLWLSNASYTYLQAELKREFSDGA